MWTKIEQEKPLPAQGITNALGTTEYWNKDMYEVWSVFVYADTAASECSFTPARSCTTVFASLQAGIHCLSCYIRQRPSLTQL
jgi:hypothetical protein